MYEVSQIGALLGGSSKDRPGYGLSGTFLSSPDRGDQLQAMRNVLEAAYVREFPAEEVDLSDGLEQFIRNNLDENTAAGLLQDISAIRKLSQPNIVGDAVFDLLAGTGATRRFPHPPRLSYFV